MSAVYPDDTRDARLVPTTTVVTLEARLSQRSKNFCDATCSHQLGKPPELIVRAIRKSPLLFWAPPSFEFSLNTAHLITLLAS